MNLLDLFIIIILGYNIVVGLKKGAIKMISGLLSIVVATIFSKSLYEKFYDSMSADFSLFIDYPFLFFGICFIVLLVGFQSIALVLHHIFKWTGVGILNHIFGCVLGFVRGTVLALMVIIPLVLIQSNAAKKSLIVYDTKPFLNLVIVRLNDSDFFADLFNKVQLPETPFKVTTDTLQDMDFSEMKFDEL